MTFIAVILILISAGIHVTWNLLWKSSSPTAAFFLVAISATAILLTPILLKFHTVVTRLPAEVWFLLGLTGFAEAVYFSSLAGAYRRGALSLAYPIARSIPVVLVALISLVLGRLESFTGLGIFGMLCVAMGCLLIPLESIRQVRVENYLNRCTLFALGAALGTTAYTLIDDQALRIMRAHPELGITGFEIPVLYSQLQTTMIMMGLLIFVAFNRVERKELPVILKRNLFWAISAGVLSALAYFFVLASMANARDVSYISAFRQVSIPLGAILGMKLQHEPVFPVRLAGIFIIFLGLVFVALG